MRRLRLWLARALLPKGWGVVPVEPGRVYKAVEAGETIPLGIAVSAIPGRDYAAELRACVEWHNARRHEEGP